jgi:prolipoprotein diacylglyceryltransferase
MHQLLHLIFEIAAFAVGYTYFQRLRTGKGDAIAEDKRVWIIIGAAAGALLGSRILGALEDPAKLAWDWRALFVAFNNRTMVGGLLGGLIGVELTKKFIGVRSSSGDLFTYPLILGMMVGRVGCMLAGLEDNTYGVRTDLPWGMDLGDGVRRHPTNLYEILWLGVDAATGRPLHHLHGALPRVPLRHRVHQAGTESAVRVHHHPTGRRGRRVLLLQGLDGTEVAAY